MRIIIAALFFLVSSSALAGPGPDSQQQGLGQFKRFDYGLKVQGAAVANLVLNTSHVLDRIDVGKNNQCAIGFVFTWAAATSVDMTCDDSSDGVQWYPIPEATKSAAILSNAQRQYEWVTGGASGVGQFWIPVIRKWLQCTFTSSGGTTDELESATATCGAM